MDPSLTLAMLLITADYAQTRQIVLHENNYCEQNVAMGHKPGLGKVNTWFAATAVAVPVLRYTLPKPWGEVYTWGVVAVEAGFVAHNYSIGLQIRF